MRILSGICVIVLLLALIPFSPRVSATSAQQVLVVYPSNGPDLDMDGLNDSKQLADYYVRKRGIPTTNVLGVTISVIQAEYYYAGEYAKFYEELAGPIKAKLDKLGPENIDVILLVGAMPLSVRDATETPISLDNSLMMVGQLDPQVNK